MTLKEIKEMEKLTIEASLARTNFNKTKAAKELGISRKQLIVKVKEYQIRDSSANYKQLRQAVTQLRAAVRQLHKQLATIERCLTSAKSATRKKLRS